MTPRARAVVLLVACGIATFALKLWANATRTTPGHGDTCYYLHVAQNLFQGRGFVCDYVWSWLENPSASVPAPSHAWWMPGPTIVAAVGMWIAGEGTYVAAKVAMAAFTSLMPAVAWWTACVVARDRALAARAAVLAVAFHLFLDQPATPLSHGPYGMIVGAALALLSAGPLTLRRGAALGALVAAGHYFRGDALTLFGTAGVLAAFRARRDGLRAAAAPLAVAAAAYVVVMAPWFARNVAVFGRPLPPGPGKAVFLRDYYDWFALPGRLDAEHYFRDGVGPLVNEKLAQTGKALGSLATSYFDPTLPPAPTPSASWPGALASATRHALRPDSEGSADAPVWLFLRQVSVLMTGLTALGLLRLAMRARGAWRAVYPLHAAAEIAFYAWLFTGVATQSYISSLYSLYPLFVVAMAASVELPRSLAARAPRLAAAVPWTAVAALVAANAVGAGSYLRAYKGPSAAMVQEGYRHLAERLVREFGFRPAADAVMLRDVWNLHAAAPIRCVRIPDEPLPRVVETAIQMNVRYFVIEDAPPPQPKARPYRAQLYRVFQDPSRFQLLYRDEFLRLNAFRILD